MHVYRRPYDYAVRNGRQRVGFRTNPSAPPVVVESESALSSAWLAQKTSKALLQDENLAESSLFSSGLIEWRTAKSSDKKLLVSNLMQQQVGTPVPAEWQGSISVNADHDVKLEWLVSNVFGSSILLEGLSVRGNNQKVPVTYTSPVSRKEIVLEEWRKTLQRSIVHYSEWLKTLSTESDIQSDWNKTQTYANAFQLSHLIQQKTTEVVPAGWQGALSIVVDRPLKLEWLATNEAGNFILAEWLGESSIESDAKTTWQQELSGTGSNRVEYLAERQTGSLVPIDWTGALSVITNHHVNAEWRKALTTEGLAVLEHLIQTAPASKLPSEHLQSLSIISHIPTGWTAGEIFSTESVFPVSWATRKVFGAPVRVEFTAGFSAKQKDVVEWLTRAGLTREMIIEHGVIVTVTEDTPAEWSGADVVFAQGNVNVWYADQRGYIWCVSARGYLWD